MSFPIPRFNSSVRREEYNLKTANNLALPLTFINQIPIREKGSIIYNKTNDVLYYSDGTAWIPIASGFITNVCIDDADGDTRVCADTIPETDSDTIFFRTAGTDRAIFDSSGVLIATAGTVDPTTIVPAAGKVAHFQGDIDVTGMVDPVGVQFAQQAAPPVVNPATEGLIYVDSAPFGPYSNTPTYVDGSNTSYPIGNLVGPGPLVTDNSIPRFDGTTGGLIQESPLTLGDTGTIANQTGDIGLDPSSGAGTVVVTGNLTVLGTTTSVNTQNVLVKDNNIYLNNGYTTTSGLSGCVTVNYLPTANSATVAGAFTAGVAAVSNPTVVTDNGHAWVAGDVIQISGANNVANDGLFEVDSYVNPLLTIRGIGTIPANFTFFQNQFTTDATAGGTITQINVANICSGTDNRWEVSVAPSNDNTTGMQFFNIPLGGSCVTVGSVLNADYATIYDAYTAGNDNVCVITDVVETTAIDLSTGPTHFRIELNPGVSVSNTIAAAADWFTGDNTVLKIVGAGYSSESASATLSSRFVLQAAQTFRSGVSAELDADSVRFTGNGTNILVGGVGVSLGGATKLLNCRFDTATRFDINLDGHNLTVSNCLFTSPVQLDSSIVTDEKPVIFSNNIFEANVTIIGATCNSVVVDGNAFENGNLTISSTNLSKTNISDNVWTENTTQGINISSISSSLTVNGNVLNNIALTGAVANSTIIGNTITTSAVFSSTFDDSNFSDNVLDGPITFTGAIATSDIVGNKATSLTFSSTVTTVNMTSNYLSANPTSMTVTGIATHFVIANNNTEGDLIFSANMNDVLIESNNLVTGAIMNSSACDKVVIIGNRSNSIDLSGATLNDCTISNNVPSSIQLGTVVFQTAVNGNQMNSTITAAGTMDLVTMSGNVSNGSWSITGPCNNCTITGNWIDTGVSFTNSLGDCIYSGNTSGTLTFGGNVSNSTLTSNNVGGLFNIVGTTSTSTIGSNNAVGGITVNSVATANCTNLTVSDNVCPAAAITFSSGAFTITSSAINGNRASSLTVASATPGGVSANALTGNVVGGTLPGNFALDTLAGNV